MVSKEETPPSLQLFLRKSVEHLNFFPALSKGVKDERGGRGGVKIKEKMNEIKHEVWEKSWAGEGLPGWSYDVRALLFVLFSGLCKNGPKMKLQKEFENEISTFVRKIIYNNCSVEIQSQRQQICNWAKIFIFVIKKDKMTFRTKFEQN